MTGRWGKNRTKKQLQTSLGQAPTQEKLLDISHIRKPINTSIFGLKEVLTLFQTATEEVQNYITFECDVLYECRVCRTIFRSIANFILHKRNYCTEKFSRLSHGSCQATVGGFVIEDDDKSRAETPAAGEVKPVTDNLILTPEGTPEKCDKDCISPEKSEEFKNVYLINEHSQDVPIVNVENPLSESEQSVEIKRATRKLLDPVIDKLLKKQEISEMVKGALSEDLSSRNENNEEEDDDVIFVSEETNVLLEKIDSTKAAVFQTIYDNKPVITENRGFMKSEVMEIHGISENNEVVLGQDGKICSFKTNRIHNLKNATSNQDLICSECDLRFSTPKTLTHHIKYKHNKSCIVYPCPDCKEPFANAWGVYRHLYKVHRRTAVQVKRMRAQIHASGVRKDDEVLKKKIKKPVEPKENEENQWLNNLEDDKDLQMCGGCGKRFERKAALHSHSQMCPKRIAVCNSLKENQPKNKNFEAKTNIEEGKVEAVEKLKGAAKRKSNYLLLQRTVSYNNDSSENRNLARTPESDFALGQDCIKTEAGNGDSENPHTVLSDDKNNSTSDEKRLDNPEVLERREALKRKRTKKDLAIKDVLREVKKKFVATQQKEKKKRKQMVVKDSKPNNSEIRDSKQEIILINENELTTETGNNKAISHETETIDSQIETVEIYTISDDSNDSEYFKPQGLTTFKEDNPELTVSKSLDVPSVHLGNLSRKRAASCDFQTELNKSSKMYSEYMDFLNDEADECFFAKVSPYMDKNELKCLPCNQIYVSQFQLLTHMSLHLGWYRFQCSKCSFLSFNKFDCASHATQQHGTPNTLLKNTVLPIPKWKMLQMSHSFKQLKDVVNNNENGCCSEIFEIKEDDDILDEEEERAMPHLEPAIQQISVRQDLLDGEMRVLEAIDENRESSDIIVINSNDEDVLKKNNNDPSSSKVVNNSLNSRPVRNRTKSVKTLQNDFIYDLGKALKLNDCSNKYKVKRAVSK